MRSGMARAESPAPTEEAAPRPLLRWSGRTQKKAIIADRKGYREKVSGCEHFADRRPKCPMGRPSRSPDFDWAPWVWSNGGGLGRRVGPTCNPREALLTKGDYRPFDDHQAQRVEQ
eukprot:476727-Pyramimonas_sp.AAC.1